VRAKVKNFWAARDQITPAYSGDDDGAARADKMWIMATEEELRKALKAFKKRIKMLQLDDDSKLGHSPLTGAHSKILSIQPPSGFGREIWDELADKGYLKRDGVGFYELVPGK
jgi:hypothetical protein